MSKTFSEWNLAAGIYRLRDERCLLFFLCFCSKLGRAVALSTPPHWPSGNVCASRPGFDPCFPSWASSRSSHTSDLKIGTLVATLPGTQHYKVSAGTGFQWQEKIRNEELWERAGQEPVAKQILRRKWGWIGHTLRKPASSTTRQALTWNPQGKRKRGRPRNSWRRDTEAELKQQGTNWSGMTRAAQNRVRWRGVVDGLCSTGSDGHK